jgi:hypothetical protein
MGIVVTAPAFDQHLRFPQPIEEFPVEIVKAVGLFGDADLAASLEYSDAFATLQLHHSNFTQEQAGLSSIQVRIDTYGHLFPSGNQGLMGR